LRALLSGGTGFVGSHLARFLADEGLEVFVFSNAGNESATDRDPRVGYLRADICDAAEVAGVFEQTQPHEVYHLAAVSSVPASWQTPLQVLETNVIGTFNLFEASAGIRPLPRVLNVSSGQVYGTADGAGHPLDEQCPVNPPNLYATSKAMAELLSLQYASRAQGFVINVRPFNHSGPGQSSDFVLSALACQIAEAEAELRPATIQVGDLNVARDFTDVRDVVRAYRLLLRSGRSGQVYNVCSGVARPISFALEVLQSLARIQIKVEVEPSRLRATEIRRICGDPTKVLKETGWQPVIPFETTVRDLLEYWRVRSAARLNEDNRSSSVRNNSMTFRPAGAPTLDEAKTMYKKVERCRICGNRHLECVLDLGEQMLTGVFPRARNARVTTGPLRLVKCVGDNGVCGLLQLEHSYDLSEMYGENYGYRSGLNPSMVAHLHGKVKRVLGQVELRAGDLVVDIGSNDSTTLQAYPTGPVLVGIDPTGVKFSSYYPTNIQLIPDFFSAALLSKRFPGKKAKIVTSFSMFYDLEDPISFMREVHEVLADDGIWVFEQSYMPAMLKTNSYDTVCHEHLEFYALRQIKWMADRVGFRILDVEFNDVNGGSFSVTVSKAAGNSRVFPSVQKILDVEREIGLDTLAPYQAFAEGAARSKRDLLEFIESARTSGKTVAALGASTKGNVLLQYCGLTGKDIPYIGEVNSDKFGSYTPGTWIPIIPETELLAMKPDCLIVLPWHFRKFFEGSAKYSNCKLIFPLPQLSC
jgi:NDP-4-keto-2,6-dideoxyhexose 3-C-methyltransferase